jgi:IS5 family transposase
MLTAGNVSDVKAAPALLKQAGRMRYLLADKGYDADRCGARSATLAPFPSSPAGAAASAPSAASRTSAASTPATTNSPPTSSQASPLPPL